MAAAEKALFRQLLHGYQNEMIPNAANDTRFQSQSTALIVFAGMENRDDENVSTSYGFALFVLLTF